jgi:hypothetical protein
VGNLPAKRGSKEKTAQPAQRRDASNRGDKVALSINVNRLASKSDKASRIRYDRSRRR